MEENFKKNHPNINDKPFKYPTQATPKQVGELAERLEKGRQMTGSDGRYNKPKKPAAAVSYVKKPTYPAFDVKGLSNDLNTYIALKEADNNNVNEKRLRAIMNEPREDKDIDKGIAAILGGYTKKKF